MDEIYYHSLFALKKTIQLNAYLYIRKNAILTDKQQTILSKCADVNQSK
ncbi:MAG TPA: hypothetical protein VKR53_06285 [Puia sp.]|nr:hypothetical protein [Puia sp.]